MITTRTSASLAALTMLVLATACTSHATGPAHHQTAHNSAVTTTACPNGAPRFALSSTPADGAALIAPGPVTATLCQYSTHVPASKVHGMQGRFTFSSLAAAGLAAVLDSAAPLAASQARCGKFANLDPFVQEVFFGYGGDRAQTAVIAFTDCNFGLVEARGQTGVLPFQTGADLFAYTSATSVSAENPATPDVTGLGAAAAVAVARRSHFAVYFNGAVLDPSAPPGTVIFQSLPPRARDSGPGSQIDVFLAAGRELACSSNQLALSFLGGGAGAGNDFATILVRDVSVRACTLAGPFRITGIGSDASAVTTTVSEPLTGVTVLTPNAGPLRWRPPGTLSGTRPGEFVGVISLMSEYRDGPSNVDNGLCAPLWVVPSAWRVTLPGGQALTVANSDPANPVRLVSSGGFVTCRGRLGIVRPAMVSAP